MKRNRRGIRGISLFVVLTLLISLTPLHLDQVLAASDKIPYDNEGANKVRIQGLMSNTTSFLRVDPNTTRADGPGTLFVGKYRFMTHYEGKISTTHLSSYNSTFKEVSTGGTIEKAYSGDPYYHMVPADKSTARNLIEVGDIDASTLASIYGGNAQYMLETLPIYDVSSPDGTKYYGEYYYIGDLAQLSGGYAINEDPHNINITRLIYLKTAWPSVQSFTAKDNNGSIQFNFNGWEYVYGQTGITYSITITKDGVEKAKFTGSGTSTKGATSTLNTRQDSGHTGSFSKSNVHSFQPTESGTYKAKLVVVDKVERTETVEITFDATGGGGTTPPPTGGGSCARDFVPTGNGSTVSGSLTSASPSGNISSDNGVYDVVQGIPSSEYLRATASSEEYLHDYNFTQKNGNVVFNNIPAEKTFTLTWTEETTTTGTDGKPVTVKTPKTETQTVKETVNGITRPYSYWEVMKYNIWQLTDSQFTNYALPGGNINISSGVNVAANATHSAVVEEHVFPAECPSVVLPAQTIEGGTTKPPVPSITAEAKSFAESAIGQNQVQNDSATFKGSTIMSNSRVSVNGPTPSSISSPSRVSMSRTGLQIEPTKTNYWQSPSTGMTNYSVVFSLDNSASNISFPLSVNYVTVHTPTVIYAKSSDDKEHDQRINPPERSTPANSDTDRHAYILDRPFTVSLPTNGQHRNIPGYGNKDYSKYIKEKQVKFPFDVYSETKQAFYPANTWISVPVNMESATFFLPVWNKEGEYTVEFRSFAINALTSGDVGGSEAQANVTIPNGTVEGHQSAAHVATDSIEVDIVGRLYDLAITDISDYNWKNTFRLADGITPSGNAYYVGQNGIDGALRGNTEKFTLPVHHGSDVNSIKNQAVKTGYSFSFNMKTKGDMESVKDAIRITPTFYHVNADGTNRQEVDLYYHQDKNYFIKIGSEKDTTYRTVTLNQTTRNVPSNELSNNAIHYFDFANRFNLEETAADYYASSFARHYLRTMSKEAIQTGPYGWQILNWKLRTLRGPLENEVPTNTVIPAKEIVSKEQTWYGEYSLPAETYVVPKGSNIEQTALMGNLYENHPIFLKEGYIIVNFKIETIQEGDLNNPYLAYYDAYYMSQWTDMEGFKSSFVDGYGNTFNLEYGDVMFYHADQSSLSDYNSSVTH